MARVVVVGGGYGGLASAVRLAKLGHDVTVLEARDTLGGAVGRLQRDGFTWDAGPTHTLLPAVARDLFRKSGRPLERELELVPLTPLRRHRFEDGTELDLPAGRADQLAAVDAALGPGAGTAWVEHVDAFADDWAALRRDYFERPFSRDLASDHARALLRTRLTLHKVLRTTFRKDERLRQVAGTHALLEGHELRDVPAWVGLWSYVEQNFGSWTVPGGMAGLIDALAARLATRRVQVELGTRVQDLVVRDGRVCGVRTDGGDLDAEVVVVAGDPRQLPALAVHVRRTNPAIPPVVAHIGLAGEVPDLPHETVLHGDPTLVVRTGGSAPAGHHAWTLLARGRISEDPVTALARLGVRVRDQVVVQVDRSPLEQVTTYGGSPYGVLWQGRGTVAHRLGPRTPIAGVHLAGASANPGAGLASVGLSASLVAQAVGPA